MSDFKSAMDRAAEQYEKSFHLLDRYSFNKGFNEGASFVLSSEAVRAMLNAMEFYAEINHLDVIKGIISRTEDGAKARESLEAFEKLKKEVGE